MLGAELEVHCICELHSTYCVRVHPHDTWAATLEMWVGARISVPLGKTFGSALVTSGASPGTCVLVFSFPPFYTVLERYAKSTPLFRTCIDKYK